MQKTPITVIITTVIAMNSGGDSYVHKYSVQKATR